MKSKLKRCSYKFLLIAGLLSFNFSCNIESESSYSIRANPTPTASTNSSDSISNASTNQNSQNQTNSESNLPRIVSGEETGPPNQGTILGNFNKKEFSVDDFEKSFLSQKPPEIYIEYSKSGNIVKIKLPNSAIPILKTAWTEAIKTYYENEVNCNLLSQNLGERHKERVARDEKYTIELLKAERNLQKIRIKTPFTSRNIGYGEADSITRYIAKTVADLADEAKKFRDENQLCKTSNNNIGLNEN